MPSEWDELSAEQQILLAKPLKGKLTPDKTHQLAEWGLEDEDYPPIEFPRAPTRQVTVDEVVK